MTTFPEDDLSLEAPDPQDDVIQLSPIGCTCAVMRIDGSQDREDQAGRAIVHALESAGHEVAEYVRVPPDIVAVNGRLKRWLEDADIVAVCIAGEADWVRGDLAAQTLERMIQRKIEGFGELVRLLAWERLGSAAMRCRALAGYVDSTLVFVVPDEPTLAKAAAEKLIAPELTGLVSAAGAEQEAV